MEVFQTVFPAPEKRFKIISTKTEIKSLNNVVYNPICLAFGGVNTYLSSSNHTSCFLKDLSAFLY